MKNSLYRIALAASLLAPVIAAMFAPAAALARDPQPAPAAAAPATDGGWQQVAMLAIEPYDHLLKDVNAVGELIENPGITAANIEGMINFFTQGRGMKGLDTTRPWGVVALTDGAQFRSIGFLPVVSLNQLLTSLGPIAGESQPGADGVIELKRPDRSLFLKESGGWAFIASAAEELDPLPADPGIVAGPLTKSYDVALHVQVKNIPAMFREIAVVYLTQAFQEGMKQQPGDDEAIKDRKKLVDARFKSITDAIDGADRFTLGWLLDEKTSGSSLEIKVDALPESSLARSFELNNGVASSLGGLMLPSGAINVMLASKLSDEEKPERSAEIDVLRDMALDKIDDWNEDKAFAKATEDLVTELADSLKQTIAAGKRDVAISVIPRDTLSAIAGAFVADPAAIEKSFKKFSAAAAKSYPGAPKPKFDADKVGDVRFHTVALPVYKADGVKLFGEQLDIALGIGPHHVYLAVGKDGLPSLKKALAASGSQGEKSSPAQAVVQVKPLVKFISSKINDDDPNKVGWDRAAATIEKLGDQDQVRLAASTQKAELTVRLDVGRDVIRLVGTMAQPPKPAKRPRAIRN